MAENQKNTDSDPIEQRLEAYAQNRRKELEGKPIELDEATLTMLRGEVERVYPKQHAEKSVPVETRMSGWLPWVAGGAICSLALVASLDFNSFSNSTNSMELAQVDQKTSKPIPVTEDSNLKSRDISPENGIGSSTVNALSSGTEESTRPTILSYETKKASPSQSGPAGSRLTLGEASASIGKSKQKTLIQPRVEPLSDFRMRKGDLATRHANSPAPLPRATRSTVPAPKTLTARSTPPMLRSRGAQPHQPNFYNNISQLRQNFRQASVIRNTSSEPRQQSVPQPVLVNFQVERRGNIVKVIDKDGSVYTGSVINEEKFAMSAASKSRLGAAGQALTQKRGRTPAGSAGGLAPATIAPKETSGGISVTTPPVEGQFFFRVQGTNQTLRKLVVFEATLDGMPDQANPQDDLKSEIQSVQSAQLLRVRGNARLGKTNYSLDAHQIPSSSYRPAVNLKPATATPRK